MKRVEAIIKPFRLDDVKAALVEIGVQGMTVTEAKGLVATDGRKETLRGASFLFDFLPKLEIVVVVPDELVQDVIQKILDAARTGATGDGKLMVSPVLDAVRIRTNERGDMAL
jgi:nitrogen regulatory protein P-II 1